MTASCGGRRCSGARGALMVGSRPRAGGALATGARPVRAGTGQPARARPARRRETKPTRNSTHVA